MAATMITAQDGMLMESPDMSMISFRLKSPMRRSPCPRQRKYSGPTMARSSQAAYHLALVPWTGKVFPHMAPLWSAPVSMIKSSTISSIDAPGGMDAAVDFTARSTREHTLQTLLMPRMLCDEEKEGKFLACSGSLRRRSFSWSLQAAD